jgi:hypothetical protein
MDNFPQFWSEQMMYGEQKGFKTLQRLQLKAKALGHGQGER